MNNNNLNNNPIFRTNETINQAFNQTDEAIELSIQNHVVNEIAQTQVLPVNNFNENIITTISEVVHNQSSQDVRDNSIQTLNESILPNSE